MRDSSSFGIRLLEKHGASCLARSQQALLIIDEKDNEVSILRTGGRVNTASLIIPIRKPQVLTKTRFQRFVLQVTRLYIMPEICSRIDEVSFRREKFPRWPKKKKNRKHRDGYSLMIWNSISKPSGA